MATENLTEYERRRLENIKRNDEMMAALKIQAKASQLSSAAKRQRAGFKSYKVSPEEKKPKTETPIVIRRSLRTRGMPPDAHNRMESSTNDSPEPPKPPMATPRVLGPVAMRDAYTGEGSDRVLIDTILRIAKKYRSNAAVKEEDGSIQSGKDEKFSYMHGEIEQKGSEKGSCGESNAVVNSETSDVSVTVGREFKNSLDSGFSSDFVKSEDSCLLSKSEKADLEISFDVGSMVLEPENIARVVPGRIMVVRFFPDANMRMIAVGNKFGNVGFWNMDHKEEDEAGIFLYRLHAGPVSGIVVQQHSLSKIVTSCYEGFIRLMDAEKEVFDLVYSSNESVFSLSQQTDNVNNLYFGEGQGGLSNWDLRSGKSISKWSLHEARINTIDFSPQNPYIMATSSTDGTACLWDLRSVGRAKPRTLNTVDHQRAVHSACFSPSGCYLATTSFDNKVGILNWSNFEDTSMIYHDNQTGRWISPFRGIWGWDDSHIFIGNMKRGVDVISPAQRKVVTTLHSPHLSAIPCRFSAHPQIVGMLAGATAGGQVYVWTSK